MKSKIIIEPLQEFSSMGVAGEILAQPNIRMVALGSPACIAALQNTAELMAAEERLIYQVLSPREYALGKNGRVVIQLLNRVVAVDAVQSRSVGTVESVVTNSVQAVIVYCSCLDVLTHWDEEEILDQVDNPHNIPIKFLYRGPLVKRRLLPKAALQRIWQELGYEPVKLAQEAMLLTNTENSAERVEVDFKNTILNHTGLQTIVLLTPGGCASCLFDLPQELRCRVYHTRFDDLALVNLQPRDFVEVIKDFFPKSMPLLLLGTSVLKAIGLSIEEICAQLVAEGYNCSC